jgi:hypothetical protein
VKCAFSSCASDTRSRRAVKLLCVIQLVPRCLPYKNYVHVIEIHPLCACPLIPCKELVFGDESDAPEDWDWTGVPGGLVCVCECESVRGGGVLGFVLK